MWLVNEYGVRTMNLAEQLKQQCTIENSKGGQYYATTYNANLDFYSSLSRFNKTNSINLKFANALNENKLIALANLLYTLDIREGKGERRIFKTAFKYLCLNDFDSAKIIIPFIGQLGRYDYLLEGLHTPAEEDVVRYISKTIEKDLSCDNPSLLAKWLPSHKNGNKTNQESKYLMKQLGITEEKYRKILSSLRKKINIVESKLTNKEYDAINYEQVPSKAMLKYKKAFKRNDAEAYNEYLGSVKKGEKKINTKGLFAYEIVKEVWSKGKKDETLLDMLWENQKDVLKGLTKNVLVVADTSGSMTCCNRIPLASSIGLAIYTAERNSGLFKDMFITFSSRPSLQLVQGKTICDKVKNIRTIIDSTDIDKVFQLILDTMEKGKGTQEDLPSHILIISDMEFDYGVYSDGGTNFQGWKKIFEEKGYQLPKIIFWNVAAYTNGCPVTKYDNDVIMVSGFSKNLLENMFDLENYKPEEYMLNTLQKYIDMLK